ncbi:expressed unknown protein [Seminavis robusta]|uniref:Uncharacterized protein n=1 Tax=Seminavis robusta TaxID=568900 RepID=A0A9N8ED86_9STRA|nr:expressed unknown protein [Seminavis robusta]|eukprot:Sro779_g201400.1 n/a (234) ;mRNA; f:46509-47210
MFSGGIREEYMTTNVTLDKVPMDCRSSDPNYVATSGAWAKLYISSPWADALPSLELKLKAGGYEEAMNFTISVLEGNCDGTAFTCLGFDEMYGYNTDKTIFLNFTVQTNTSCYFLVTTPDPVVEDTGSYSIWARDAKNGCEYWKHEAELIGEMKYTNQPWNPSCSPCIQTEEFADTIYTSGSGDLYTTTCTDACTQCYENITSPSYNGTFATTCHSKSHFRLTQITKTTTKIP